MGRSTQEQWNHRKINIDKLVPFSLVMAPMPRIDDVRVLIVEDEVPAMETLVEYCSFYPALKITKTVRTGREALSELMTGDFDLVFIDIQLPDMSGVDVIRQAIHLPPVILCTAFSEYAAQAFELGVVDFLLKPFGAERFKTAVARILDIIAREHQQDMRPIGVSVRDGENFVFIPFQEIIYVVANGKRCVVHTVQTEFDAPQLLASVARKLPTREFLRIHKQFVVNLRFISHLQYMAKGDYVAFLKDEEQSQLPVSRMHAQELKTRLGYG